MESKGTTVVASCIHQALTDSHRYTTLTDATTPARLVGVKPSPKPESSWKTAGQLLMLIHEP